MPKILHKDIPSLFEICLHADCPRAASCLRQIACAPLMERDDILRLANPSRCTKDDACPHFRDAAPVAYARGFKQMQQHMYPDQYRTFRSLLTSRFGLNPYYERRKGSIALSPAEQQIVLHALRCAGVTEELKFDRYEESPNWYD